MLLKHWQLGLALTVGGLFGFVAANSHWERAANGAVEQRTEPPIAARTDVLEAKVPRYGSAATGGCSMCASKGEMLALAAHNQLVAAALAQTGKKPNLCIIWGDDVMRKLQEGGGSK